ncbi:MAG: UTP--glucose-1-phosphate uridylyltransferase [Phycisphaerae bacterium]
MPTPHLHHDALLEKVIAAGQEHVYHFYDTLTEADKEHLDTQVAAMDWDLISRLVTEVVLQPVPFELPRGIEPAPYFPYEPRDTAMRDLYAMARQRGVTLLRDGQIAAFVVAGGQGTRLGWPGPKGTFPATPVSKKPLFECFVEYLRALESRHHTTIPFYIMTSTANHDATVDFFRRHHYFSMPESQIMFLSQDMLPAVGFDGKVLLESPASMALSPNGHGGSLLALHKSGALSDMRRRGVTQISYFQVDNPIVRCVDPLFIGLHDMHEAEMSSKMLPKAFAKEKLGNFCLVDGKIVVIEYSDLPEQLAEALQPDGQLKFRAGSIALHAIRQSFVEQLNAHGFALPYHRAEKKVPHINLQTGKPVNPTSPNAVKMETFVFDALPLATKSIIYETDRIDEFAPIKNAEGVDSPASAADIITRRNSRWLAAASIRVPQKADGSPDAVIEISPTFAIYPEDVVDKYTQVPPIAPGSQVYLP